MIKEEKSKTDSTIMMTIRKLYTEFVVKFKSLTKLL